MSRDGSRNKFAALMLASVFLMGLSSCGLFKKKCDCPKWSDNKIEKKRNEERV